MIHSTDNNAHDRPEENLTESCLSVQTFSGKTQIAFLFQARLPLSFRHYSKDLLPQADHMVTYLRDYQQRLGIDVVFNTDIRNLRLLSQSVNSAPDRQQLYMMEDQHGNTYSCKWVHAPAFFTVFLLH